MTVNQRSFKKRSGRYNLYTRPDSPFFQAYLLPNNRKSWIRLSTGTDDFEEAKEIAMEKLGDLKRDIENGFPIGTRNFRSVAEETIKGLKNQISNGEANTSAVHHIGYIQNNFIPFFGNFNIENITEEKLVDFNKWRREKYGRTLNKNTIQNHTTAMGLVFKTAIKKKWMKENQVPTIKNEGAKSVRRSYFNDEELQILENALDRKWIENGENKKIREVRELFRDVFSVICGTGIRHGTEFDGIRWKNIDGDLEGVYAMVKIVEGKTKKTRKIVADEIAVGALKNLRARFPGSTQEDFVFRTRSGKPYDRKIRSIAQKEFKKVMIELGLLYDDEGNIRTPYSLRHTYATYKLSIKNLNIHKLAKQMGTSTKIIDSNYSHLETERNAAEIAN